MKRYEAVDGSHGKSWCLAFTIIKASQCSPRNARLEPTALKPQDWSSVYRAYVWSGKFQRVAQTIEQAGSHEVTSFSETTALSCRVESRSRVVVFVLRTASLVNSYDWRVTHHVWTLRENLALTRSALTQHSRTRLRGDLQAVTYNASTTDEVYVISVSVTSSPLLCVLRNEIPIHAHQFAIPTFLELFRNTRRKKLTVSAETC